MTGEPETRASDQDRERTAVALGGHYAAGRLSLEEFQERLDRVYAAKTLGELGDLMADLPGNDLSQLPGQPGGNPLPAPRAPGTVQVPGGSYPAIWRFWLAVTIVVFAIWLISGASGEPWLVWVVVPLVFILLRRRITGGGCRVREHHQGRP